MGAASSAIAADSIGNNLHENLAGRGPVAVAAADSFE